MAEYADKWITCSDTGLRVRGYYFPWGTRRIPYNRIRSVRRVDTSALRGRGRIWGTANPRYWANLDPKRPGKRTALVLDVGRFVRPYLTPDDPDTVQAAIRAHTDVPIETDGAGPVL